MQNTTNVLTHVLSHLPAIQTLAYQAGEAIMQIYKTNSRGDLGLKTDQSPVTLADQTAHDYLIQGLSHLFPELAICSEEGHETQALANTEAFWLIDPLDGTKEFLAGQTDFTVNIALIVAGRSVWGLVHAPALGLMYWGGQGLGAYRQAGSQIDALTIPVREHPEGPYRIVASRSHLNAATQAWIAEWSPSELIQAGSSLKFCRLAEDLADLYPRLAPTCEWDTAAAQAVLEGAGGFVFDLQGDVLRYGKREILNPSFIASHWSWEDLTALKNLK